MKGRFFLAVLTLLFAAQAAALFLFARQQGADGRQDAAAVNKALQSLGRDWANLEGHKKVDGLAYVALGPDEEVRYRTQEGLSESINEAVLHRDTVLDIRDGSSVVGKLIVYNDSAQVFQAGKQAVIRAFLLCMLAQGGLCAGYFFYLNGTIVKPFRALEGFAERVAGGNLDVPLAMDRQNLFGAFTESFDLMRVQLKEARQAEIRANESKKELVAKLSHDIKTPVASIKAASEVGAALADQERLRDNYRQIIRKADQIDSLITNLFTATLEELKQLSVTPQDLESREIRGFLESADYLGRASLAPVPGCILRADPLRLQQVFDNLFANSYKYAGTQIEATVWREESCLAVALEDHGGGVDREEISFLKEKYRRGRNAQNIEGAGLGLYIADYFMREMKGELFLENGADGLRAVVRIPLSGRI